MKAQHIPGPWSIEANRVIAASGKPIASIPRTLGKDNEWKHKSAENEANAKLIAAAPELLAALIHMKNRLDNAVNAGNCMSYADAVTGEAGACMEDYVILRTAIAKATTTDAP